MHIVDFVSDPVVPLHLCMTSAYRILLPLILSHSVFAINFATDARHQKTVPQAAPAAGPDSVLPGTPRSDDDYKVTFTLGHLNDGSTGTIDIRVHPGWAPAGAQRFKELLDSNFFDDSKFFRVIPGFVAQFGLAGDAKLTGKWIRKVIHDDPPMYIPNSRGRVTFATAGKDSRAVQIFINLADNTYLDSQGFTPFAEVISGMDVVDKLYSEYGEGAPLGKGPSQNAVESLGNKYLEEAFPKLSTIDSVTVFPQEGASTLWGNFGRISFILTCLVGILAIGTVTLYRTGKLEKLLAAVVQRAGQWKRSTFTDATAHQP